MVDSDIRSTVVPLWACSSACPLSKLLFQVIPGLTGKAYVGRAGMTRSTLSGVIRVLWPNAAGGISDSFFLEASDGADSINLASYWIDMDVAAEGLLITYWTE